MSEQKISARESSNARFVERLLRIGTHTSWIVLLLVVAIASFQLRESMLNWGTALTIVGGIASICAFGLTFIIARGQDFQLRDLTRIATDTKVTAQKLQTDSVLGEEGQSFFNLGSFPADESEEQYRCYRTATHYDNSERLPYTPVAEDFCVQMLQRVFSACKRRIYLVNVFTEKENLTDRTVPDLSTYKHLIFLKSSFIPAHLLDRTGIPCWFREREIFSNGRALHPPNSSMSIGILARLQHGPDENSRLVLLEGKTQSGTWVVGHFLGELLAQANSESIPPNLRKAFAAPGAPDLIVVLAGQFDQQTYEVRGSVQILSQWIKRDGAWFEELTSEGWPPAIP